MRSTDTQVTRMELPAMSASTSTRRPVKQGDPSARPPQTAVVVYFKAPVLELENTRRRG
jgi:hypothetical protein